jgi:hypothetical protein
MNGLSCTEAPNFGIILYGYRAFGLGFKLDWAK